MLLNEKVHATAPCVSTIPDSQQIDTVLFPTLNVEGIMGNDALQKSVDALSQFCLIQAGQIGALKLITDAMVETIGSSMPPMLEPLFANVEELADNLRGTLEPDTLNAFNNMIRDFQYGIALLRA
jgi:hypothetical protein